MSSLSRFTSRSSESHGRELFALSRCKGIYFRCRIARATHVIEKDRLCHGQGYRSSCLAVDEFSEAPYSIKPSKELIQHNRFGCRPVLYFSRSNKVSLRILDGALQANAPQRALLTVPASLAQVVARQQLMKVTRRRDKR